MAPRTLTGSLHPSNRNAIAWSEHGLLAFGCHSTIVIADVQQMRVVQTLDKHHAAVNRVCWAPENASPTGLASSEPELRCASSDISGNLIIWNVLNGISKTTFRYANNAVALEIYWYPWQDMSRDFLLALHAPSTIVLWNCDTGEKIWAKTYGNHLYTFALDPFNLRNLAFGSTDHMVLLVDDLSLHKVASGSVRAVNVTGQEEDSNKELQRKEDRTTKILSLVYHRSCSDMLLILTHGSLYVLDTDSLQIIAVVPYESNSAPFVQVLSTSMDCLITVQQGGQLVLRTARYDTAINGSINGNISGGGLHFDRLAMTESTPRASVQQRLMGAALCPQTENSVALMLNSGRLLFYQLASDSTDEDIGTQSNLLKNLIKFDSVTLHAKATAPLRWGNIGLIPCLNHTLSVLRVRPMDAINQMDDSLTDYGRMSAGLPLAAIGSHSGIVHLVDLSTCTIWKDLQIHTCPIKCLEWGGPNVIISAAYSNTLSGSAIVRNDIFATDIRVSRRIRPEADETPVEMLRVSFYHCYLAIAFRNEPLEIWHLKSFRLLRRMSKSCPIITDMAWSGKHHNAKTAGAAAVYRENLVVLDNNNQLYHVVVKGLHVRDGKEVTTEWKPGMGNIRAMVWKDDLIALGDNQGRLAIWNLAGRQCRQTGTGSSSRGPIQRMQFSRLNGDATLAVLHSNMLILWDAAHLTQIQQVSTPSPLPIIDMDLHGLDPVVLSSDNCLRIFGASVTAGNAMAPMLDCVDEFPFYILDSSAKSDLFLAFASGDGKLAKAFAESNSLQKGLESLRSVSTEDRIVKRAIQAAIKLGDGWSVRLWTCIAAGLNTYDLPPSFEVYWPAEVYKARRLQRLDWFDPTNASPAQLNRHVEMAILLGRREQALGLLLTGAGLTEALRACLLAADLTAPTCQSTVKLVATSLIASSRIHDGAQLLFLVGHGLDACRYLQSHGFWMNSVCYAKAALGNQAKPVLLKWVEHLTSPQIGQKSLALQMLASMGEWKRLLELLMSMQLYSIAQLVTRAIVESGVAVEAELLEQIEQHQESI